MTPAVAKTDEMQTGTIVLYTDQQSTRSDLLTALQRIAPCAVLRAAEPPPSGPYAALVVDLDLLQPSPFTGLRALIAATPGLPRIFLMRSMGQRSLSAARGLGGSLCLPADTPIETVVEAISSLGGQIESRPDGFRVEGRGGIEGGRMHSAGDHRLAMLGAIAGLASSDGVDVDGMDACEVSYPGFERDLARLAA